MSHRARLRILAALLGLLAMLLGATPALAQVSAGDRRAVRDQIDAIVDAIGDGDSDPIRELLLRTASPDLRAGLSRLDGFPVDVTFDSTGYEQTGNQIRANGRLTVNDGRTTRSAPAF